MKPHSQTFLRHRKFLMVLPLLTLPFIVMIFWALGGGKGNSAGAEELSHAAGINTHLPDANLKEENGFNKMSFYDQATADSLKRLALMKGDPSYKPPPENRLITRDSLTDAFAAGNAATLSRYGKEARDPNEEKVYSKIAQLNSAMSQAKQQAPAKTSNSVNTSTSNAASMNTADVDRLEQMMHVMKNGSDEDDPEMTQLNGMLDKIMDIQHPDRLSEKIKQLSQEHQSKVYPVSVREEEGKVSLFERMNNRNGKDTIIHEEDKGFFSLNTTAGVSREQNTIEAIVHETGSVVTGATVKLRLASDVYISGVLVPKGTFIFGTAAVNDERLKITIQSIRYQSSIFPVKLSVYDLDGMEGIFIPGAITRDVAKLSADQAIQGIGISNLNSSLPVQAASAGITAVKSLLTKKAKLVKVSVTAGYQVLLKDAG